MTAEKDAIEVIRDYMRKTPDNDLVDLLKEKKLLVMTEDGTYTLRSTSEKELMHSRMGALKESREKFINPSQISQIDSPRILDLCSGLGYNTIAALEANPKSEITMIELVPEMLYLGKCLSIPSKGKKIFNIAVENYFNNIRENTIQIYCNDARIILGADLSESQFDMVFHDGFSPGKDPVLYTVDFLRLLKNNMKKNGLLISYSSSIPFRSALILAGFFIEEGPSVGRKRGITLASPSLSALKYTNRISRQDEQLIALTTTGIPFRDEDFELTGKKILENRDKERKNLQKSANFISTKQIKKGNIDKSFIDIQDNSSNSNESIGEMNKFLLTKK